MAQPLTIEIDFNAPEPAYHQIASQIRQHIASGGLGRGAVLPGVRSLAADLGVNMNTVARAYRVLEEQGFVRIRDRSGVEVASPPRRIDPGVRASLEQELTTLLARMRQAGLTSDQVRRMVARTVDAQSAAEREGGG